MTKDKKLQSGIALLLMLFLTLGVGATILLYGWNSSRGNEAHKRKTELALQQAKDAIIAWSAAHPTLPGMLPCPEDTTLIGGQYEGKAQNCSNTGLNVGRIAWRTLGLDNPIDANGEQLWYVLSPGFRASPINSESAGQIMIDTFPQGAVALIIAPGPELTWQSRSTPTATTPPNFTQYLDGTNSDGDTTFSTIQLPGIINDQVIAIFPSDLMHAVEKRVANEVRYALQEYYCGVGHVDTAGNCTTTPIHGYFPRPAAFSDTTCLGGAPIPLIPTACPSMTIGNEGRLPANPVSGWDNSSIFWSSSPTTWFQANRWRELVYYGVAPACIDGTMQCNGAGGYITVKHPGAQTSSGTRVVIIVGSSYLGSLYRNKTVVADYLEDQNATQGDNTFTQWSATTGASFNDLLVAIP